MLNKNKRISSGTGCAPYAGSGTLSDYKKDGSWVMNQISKGYDKVQRGITVRNQNDHIRFSKKINKIASKLIVASDDYKIIKTYKQLSSASRNDYRFALRWEINGALDGSSLSDLEIIKELLNNKINTDCMKMNASFKINMDYLGQACIDFRKSCIKVEGVVSFECNIVTDVKQITDFLNKLGFETAIKQE